ncbi:MAG: DUF937 domain-containing protein [Bacteroidia bacterium]
MLENLLSLVKEHAGDAIINNPAIPNEQNEAAIGETANGIMSALQSQASGGNLQNILGMFQGGDAANSPVASAISNNVAGNLMNKFGIDSGQAGNIVQTMLPGILNSLVNKTNDPNDSSFNLQDIVSKIGGNAGGVGSMLGNLFGK